MFQIFPRAEEIRAIEQRQESAMRRRLEYYARHHEEIQSRLDELSSEPDLESQVRQSSSLCTLAGLILGATSSRRWYLLAIAAQACSMQWEKEKESVAAQIHRRRGLRSREEILQERFALKALRGDVEAYAHEHFNGDGGRSVSDLIEHVGSF